VYTKVAVGLVARKISPSSEFRNSENNFRKTRPIFEIKGGHEIIKC
jgi:hypothetical protein